MIALHRSTTTALSIIAFAILSAVISPAAAAPNTPSPGAMLHLADTPFSLARDTASAVAVPTHKYVKSWGTQGSGDDQFDYPWAIDVDARGRLYVTDTSNHRVKKMRAGGAFLTAWGSWGTADGQFNGPRGIGVGPSGKVYVVDYSNERVQKFAKDGTFRRAWGTQGYDDGEFAGATVLAIDRKERIYVADQLARRVQKFRSDGTYLLKWTWTKGTGYGQFQTPNGLAVGPAGKVYMSDYLGDRVAKFGSDGTLRKQWGTSGSGPGQLDGPTGVACDSLGYVYVAEAINDRVSVFTTAGDYVTSFGAPGYKAGQFDEPYDVAFDPSENVVYVVDNGNNRIQKWTRSFDTPSVAGDGILAVSSLATALAPDGTIDITFTLSRSADVVARAMNLAGRPVKTICSAMAGEPGTNTLLWNAESDAGVVVPNGTYLVEVTARAEDGAQARALTQVQVRR